MRLNTILLSGLVACASLGSAALAGDWVQWSVGPGANGHWYQAVYAPSQISWEDARGAAALLIAPNGQHGYLATIHSEEENNVVFTIVTDPKYWVPMWNGPWLGGYQPPGSPEPDGGWTWVTGEPWTYTNWAPNEPNNAAPGENALHFSWYAGPPPVPPDGHWNDMPSFYPWKNPGYVVEAVPEPATLGLLAAGALVLVRRRRA